MDLAKLIEAVQAEMGEVIQKPKMAEKLLSRPPFRFLHDVVSAVTQATGFAEGLYGGDELDSGTIADKQAKISYLDKIFNMVGICEGRQIEIDALKVVQGLNPEETNKFILALARCAQNKSLDSRAAVDRTLAGERPGNGPVPVRGAAAPSRAEAKPEPQFENQSKMSNVFDGNRDNDKGSYDSKGVVEAALDSAQMAERGKSRGGTRGGKPAAQSGSGAGLTVASAPPPFIEGEIERCDGNQGLTQDLVGALIQKPKMAEKLLSKPPFRFLHDTISEVVKVTGFGAGLYTEEEMDSATIDSKEKKIEYLQKIITLVGLHLNTIVDAKPAKIVAGQEPQSTNRLLQLLALCATHMPESSASVRNTLESMGLAAPQVAAPVGQPRAEEKKARPKPQREAVDLKAEEPPQQHHDDRDDAPDDKGSESNLTDATSGDQKRSLRPTTARRKPPKVNLISNVYWNIIF